MEPSYSEWKPLMTTQMHYVVEHCPYCEKTTAKMMCRFVTDREGQTERQYRVECPICQHHGNTYFHESTARLSWHGRENDPPEDYIQAMKRRRNKTYY